MSEATTSPAKVLDIGAGADPDPRADITLDCVPLDGVDVVHDLEEHPWPFETGSLSRIVARHVVEHLDEPEKSFAEAGRVLEDRGVFEVHVPIGLDARTDPTHVHEWTWDTAKYFTSSPPYDYGWELPFQIKSRDVEWWVNGPFSRGSVLLRRWEERHGPGKWLSGVPGLSGVLIVEYRRAER